jgi:2-polyprenyl-3-methyl-5-hydroxy-6-metoxy-1,4-benzoquinol methylase
MTATTACLLCGGANIAPRYYLGEYRIAHCGGCGLEFNADFRHGDSEEGTFGQEYFTERHHAAFEAALTDYRKDPSVPVFTRRLEQLEARTRRGTLIDVGCGPGTFLRVARDHGWKVEGVDISHFAAAQAQASHGIVVNVGDLQALDRAAESVDVITMWDSLEHVGDPAATLAAAHRLLRPGGLLLVATDNFDCLVADIASWMYRLSFGRLRYGMRRVFIDRNRSYFTGHTLNELLQRAGFRSVWEERMEYPLDKIETTPAERLLLKTLYMGAAILGRQAQVTVIAERA